MLSNHVSCCWGQQVLRLLNAIPNRPEEAVSAVKDEGACCAASIAWGGTATPPIVTVSEYTIPDELLWSENVIAQVSPVKSLAQLVVLHVSGV